MKKIITTLCTISLLVSYLHADGASSIASQAQTLGLNVKNSIETALSAVVNAQADATLSPSIKDALDTACTTLASAVNQVKQAASQSNASEALNMLKNAHLAAVSAITGVIKNAGTSLPAINDAASKLSSNSTSISQAQDTINSALTKLSSSDAQQATSKIQKVLSTTGQSVKQAVTDIVNSAVNDAGINVSDAVKSIVNSMGTTSQVANTGAVKVQTLGAAASLVKVYTDANAKKLSQNTIYRRTGKKGAYNIGICTINTTTKDKKGHRQIQSTDINVVEDDATAPSAKILGINTNKVIGYIQNPKLVPGTASPKTVALYQYATPSPFSPA